MALSRRERQYSHRMPKTMDSQRLQEAKVSKRFFHDPAFARPTMAESQQPMVGPVRVHKIWWSQGETGRQSSIQRKQQPWPSSTHMLCCPCGRSGWVQQSNVAKPGVKIATNLHNGSIIIAIISIGHGRALVAARTVSRLEEGISRRVTGHLARRDWIVGHQAHAQVRWWCANGAATACRVTHQKGDHSLMFTADDEGGARKIGGAAIGC